MIRRILLLGLCLSLAACNPFRPRSAEDPAETSEWKPFPISPVEVEEDLTLAFGYRQNLSRYGELFAGDFAFIPDPQDINEYNLPSSWGGDFEYYSLAGLWNRVPASGTINLALTADPDRDDEILAAHARLYRVYAITLPGATGFENLVYHGRCCLYLEDRDGLWNIVRWNDYRTDTAPTWGRLKYDAAP